MDNFETSEHTPLKILAEKVKRDKEELRQLQQKLGNQFPSFMELILSQPGIIQSTDSNFVRQWELGRGQTIYTVTQPNKEQYPNAVDTIEIQKRGQEKKDGMLLLKDTRFRLNAKGEVERTDSYTDLNQTQGDTIHTPFSTAPDQIPASLSQMKEFANEIQSLQDSTSTK